MMNKIINLINCNKFSIIINMISVCIRPIGLSNGFFKGTTQLIIIKWKSPKTKPFLDSIIITPLPCPLAKTARFIGKSTFDFSLWFLIQTFIPIFFVLFTTAPFIATNH